MSGVRKKPFPVQRFRGLIEKSDDLIVVMDGKLRIKYVSPNYQRITGIGPESIQTHGFGFYVDRMDQDAVKSIMTSCLKSTGVCHRISCRFGKRGKRDLCLEGTVINSLHEKSVRGVVLNVRDVTARKKTEESLQQSQANLKAIIENSDASIYSIDREFRYIAFNGALRRALKQVYGLEINVGDRVFDFLDKLDPVEASEWKSRYTEGLSGKVIQFVEEFEVEGSVICTAFSIHPIVETEQVIGLSCFARDITAERLADKKLQENEARFRALIESSYDAITLRDRDLNLKYASPRAIKMMGYSAKEGVPEFYARFHPDDVLCIKGLFTQSLLNPGKEFNYSIRVLNREGNYIWVEGGMRNLLENDSVKGVVFNYHDISERMKSELQRERMTADITQRVQSLEQFAYIVSHNLRAPVANILGISAVLKFPDLTESNKTELINNITSSAARLDEVVKDLNNILASKKNITECKQIINLRELVNDITLSLSDLIEITGAHITSNFAELPKIQSTKTHIHSIFYNLIINALKYRRKDTIPSIQITSRRLNDRVELVFSDNGVGIDLKLHGSDLFGLYKRFHFNTEGKGMGLFMVKKHVEELGGTISVKSEVNQGSEFRIIL